ncbi:MAG: hypothetical protein QNJ70_24965 [Xenococcaceae cyanobacterium MO_207.B15]|nr:hypothetical protein [Xenococcaceae cyanobacterium MO_207.B15]
MKLTLKKQINEIALRIIYWHPYYTGKIIFCRPRGGLNDMLCQIDKCRIYAIKSNRKLWVDTSRSGFHDCLSNYFEPIRDFYFGSPINNNYADNSYFPKFLTHKIDSYESEFDRSFRKFVDKETRTPLTFNFKSYYSEKILLHEQCGGGFDSIRTLDLLQLKQDIRRKIKYIIENIGEYDSIHIRNTDLKTDYKYFFNKLRNKIKRRVVICTDDFNCQQYARDFWGDKLTVVHSLIDTKGKPLHLTNFKKTDRYRVNIETLTDLLVLASAKNFYKCQTNQGRVSGFAELAESLRSNPRVIKRLLN